MRAKRLQQAKVLILVLALVLAFALALAVVIVIVIVIVIIIIVVIVISVVRVKVVVAGLLSFVNYLRNRYCRRDAQLLFLSRVHLHRTKLVLHPDPFHPLVPGLVAPGLFDAVAHEVVIGVLDPFTVFVDWSTEPGGPFNVERPSRNYS